MGSDVDLVIVVRQTAGPRSRRALGWDATDLPVPADVLVYTAAEWSSLEDGGSRSDPAHGLGMVEALSQIVVTAATLAIVALRK